MRHISEALEAAIQSECEALEREAWEVHKRLSGTYTNNSYLDDMIRMGQLAKAIKELRGVRATVREARK